MHVGEQDRTVSDKLYLTDDGLQFDGSILWLDSKKNGNLSFLSSAMSVRERHESQVIVSEESYQLLKLYNPALKALVCQYNRPFSIGRYDLELLPAGSVLGGASLLIDTGYEKILYAPILSDSKNPLTRALQSKPIDYLVLRVDHCDSIRSLVAKRKEEQARLVHSVESCLAQGRIPVVLTPLLHTASEVCSLLSKKGLRVLAHKHIANVNKIYETCGHPVGNYKVLNPSKEEAPAVFVVPPSFRSKKIFLSTKEHQFFFVNDKLDSSYDHTNCDTFNIPLPQIGTNVLKIVKDLKPKKTFLLGPYAKKFVSLHKSTGLDLEVLDPFHQASLL